MSAVDGAISAREAPRFLFDRSCGTISLGGVTKVNVGWEKPGQAAVFADTPPLCFTLCRLAGKPLSSIN